MSHGRSGSARNGQHEAITPREREVAGLIAQGLSNEEIAERLVVTTGTVANHVAHILTKFGMRSRVEIAVKIANDRGRTDTTTLLGFLATLSKLDSATVQEAMTHAADVLAAAFAADKVDAFFYDERTDMLVALGTSQTPMGKRQHELGLHRLAVSNGGRTVRVFLDARSSRSGQVEKDPQELIAIWRDLGVRSTIAVPIEVGADQRGVLQVCSAQPEHFTEDQLQLLQFIAYWIGLVARDRATDHHEQ
jgi:DNA-binding CsgD family transcriptional regulator